jgi:integrase
VREELPRPRKPYLLKETTRHGKTVWYVRRGDGPRIRVHGEFGTDEFNASYDAAISGERSIAKPQPPRSGSLQWLYDRYRESGKWFELSEATRRQRENILGGVMKTAGAEPFARVTRKSVEAGKDRRRETPAQARNFLDAMRGLFGWAVEAGHVTVDPTYGVKNPKRRKTEGFKAWTEEDVAAYKRRWPLGTKEYVWLAVLLYTRVRRGDAVTLGRQHIKNGAITFITEKGRDKRRIEVTRRIEPELQEAIDAGPCGDLAFICGDRGSPLTKESFGNVFKDACVEAGILDKSAHGLRKLAATFWAERGATVHELMAMFGWLTVQMAELYTRAAERKRLSLNAHTRLAGTPAEHHIPAPSEKVRGSSAKR